MNQDHFLSSLERTWARLSQVAVHGAEYDSRERQPHPKCLEGTRVDLLDYIYRLLDNRGQNRLIWLHGTAGVGKSAVAFTVAERMRSLKMTEETNVEKRLAGTFFFSQKHTERCTTAYFFATLVYQLASNFPSIRADVSKSIRDNPALLDPSKSLRVQVETLFLQPLRGLHLRLRGCQPLTFIVDALDECTSEFELADLILSLARVLHEPDLPAIHILLTSRSESHICRTMENEEVRSLVCEIPAAISGKGIGSIISLDSANVDNDIYIFLRHSFGQLGSRHLDFPQPSTEQLERLASRAGGRFIVASTMMKFIDNEDNDPYDQLMVMLELTSELLPGTEVFKFYDCILSTCADPKRAYLHLSVVAVLTDPLPLSQISTLLGPGLGKDVEATLIQLRSVMDIPADSTLPVNIYHSSIRDYVSDTLNCSLRQVHDMPSPHCLLAHSSFRLMMKGIPENAALLDALSQLEEQSCAMERECPHVLKHSLAFLIQPPEPLSVLSAILWLRGDRSSQSQSWLETVEGRNWLQTDAGQMWLLWSEAGKDWLLNTRAGKDWLLHGIGKEMLVGSEEDWLQDQDDQQTWVQAPGKQAWVQISGERSWMKTPSGRDWLQTPGVKDWLQTQDGRHWLHTPGGQFWLHTRDGRDWLQTPCGRDWLQTPTLVDWRQTQAGREWLQTQGAQDWLQTQAGREWLQTTGGRNWLQTLIGREWLRTQGGRNWLEGQDVQAALEEFSNTLEAMNRYIILPEMRLLPAFQVIQQFKNLPDFLMFPMFLALRRHHSTSASPSLFPIDEEIMHAMYTFTTFADEALERSRSASEALKYACRNWAVHLSRAPRPWDNKLDHIFHAFWNRRLLSWLELQWCLKGLQSCLAILSEGQKLAKPNTVQPAIVPDPKTSTMQSSTPPPTSEMLKKEPSSPILTPPSGLVGTPHVCVTHQHTSWRPPSSPPFTPPLPHSPSLELEIAVSHTGASRKRTLDELGLDSDIPFEYVATLTPTKRLKRDSQSVQPE
ncbi:uncharacterized protein F5891DRAFT_663421 [Suillus fuscotomentosus]|uniref:NACHT domain-containing protein n=1 Tax=Suillus fuscotomentosus TaxID=1912939 RepID=A0AAD4HGD5_9AGAM|nr:uncharacterized protein F5891DRAFT_663421 [Suillus fuscotomentosus]KAG1895573.1 hypothetical protein F5891DRAFT_663421 [Suillus fuscotomentosus]